MPVDEVGSPRGLPRLTDALSVRRRTRIGPGHIFGSEIFGRTRGRPDDCWGPRVVFGAWPGRPVSEPRGRSGATEGLRRIYRTAVHQPAEIALAVVVLRMDSAVLAEGNRGQRGIVRQSAGSVGPVLPSTRRPAAAPRRRGSSPSRRASPPRCGPAGSRRSTGGPIWPAARWCPSCTAATSAGRGFPARRPRGFWRATSWPVRRSRSSTRCQEGSGRAPDPPARTRRHDTAPAGRTHRQPRPRVRRGAAARAARLRGDGARGDARPWFARDFERFLVFGSDGTVYESPDPVWDEKRVARRRG